ncbi:hypothetical protein IF1G_09373 [Cordyceps javanica]|uniref:F-box domain-containing protein n=1 Tax=Cordyceps javanica TaxID=43265 RepID=A0A545UQR0_9HYPO|nr:hypothetical protein IF1G_09373 [Cordyceps javanica]
MSLLQLPPETLGLIFKQIGSGFFQEDIKRLTICKRWYEFALAECLRRVILTVDSLKHVVRAGIFEPPSALIGSCQILGLHLGGNRSTSHNEDSRLIQAEASQEGGLVDRYALDHDLTQLATLTQRSRKLHTLHIQAWSFPLGPLGSQEDYLSLPTIRSLLAVDNLSVLVLDLLVGFWNPDGYRETGCQLCPNIGTLLGNLQELQLRTRTICPCALKPRSHSSGLRLHKCVVNLSLATNLPWKTSASHAQRCGSNGGGLLQLKADLQKQAESLVPRMATPKTLRILTHLLPTIEIRSLDVLTGKTMILDDNAAWDQDGRFPEEFSASESELSDDALAAFLDSDDD